MKGTIKKIANGNLPTGPDKYYGGDGLPDWMQFSITVGMFGLLYWIMALDNFRRYGYEILVFKFITICHVMPTGIMIYLISKKKFSPFNATLFGIDKYFIKKIFLFLITIYFSFLLIFIINMVLLK